MLLIDSNGICHSTKHTLDSLSWEEKKVGVIYGFLRQLLSLSKTFDSNQFVFVWDSRQSLRTKIFPDYKKARRKEKSPEEKELDDIAYAQFDILRTEIIPTLGFKNNFMLDGYEADDIIAKICQTYPHEEINIISADEDLYQLLSKNIFMYSIKKKQMYTANNLWKDYRIIPEEWGEVKAIAGCSTDGVPGVDHVGETTACKYLTLKLPKHHKAYQDIKNSTKLIQFNKKLVVLPLKGTPEIELISDDFLYLKNFINICQRYGFNSLMDSKSLDQWKQYIFKGENICKI
jgi:DNA polymerase I